MLVIGFSGRKQSGKDSAIDFLTDHICSLSTEHLRVQKYGFADKLKEICIDLLGLTPEQCYGTDEDKNTLTVYEWEKIPVFNTEDFRNVDFYEKWQGVLNQNSLMTARQVLQQVGTEIFRKMRSDVWISYLLNKIQAEAPQIAFISDARFVNECEAIKAIGGKIIRLTRKIDPNDNHPSEAEMDGYEGADAIIDNQNMTVDEKNSVLLSIVKPWIQEHLFDLVGE